MSTQHTSRFLMANLGSEMQRVFMHKESGDAENLKNSITRARDILAKVSTHEDMRSRARELQALALILDDISSTTPKLHIQSAHIKSFFIPIALLLQNGKI